MTLTVEKRMTAEAFEAFALLPGNRDRLLEFIGGRIIEVVSSSLSSSTGAIVLGMITLYVRQHRLGVVTGADGGYIIGGDRCIPDAAYMSYARQPIQPDVAYNPVAPDLAVEVLSPSNHPEDMRLKIVSYLNAGTTVWLFDPYSPHAEVYSPGRKPIRLSADDILDGGSVLPGFSLPLSLVFGKPDPDAPGVESEQHPPSDVD
ncbi:MAG: Uma2 family endonuclease [Anaerolineae bacterium]|nr:Uma2 family endonuclease [Anaerolineae bacterium]